MSCAACSGRVQRAHVKTDGDTAANVNLMLKNAIVEYEPGVIRPAQLVDTIRETGYEAEIVLKERTAFEEQEAQDRAQEEEFRDLRFKAVVSFIVAAIAMIVSIPLMAAGEHLGPVADPFKRWTMGWL